MKLAWCSGKAARYACENWHYSGTIPVTKRASIGVWEDGAFRGAIVFGQANLGVAESIGVSKWQCCELCRVALLKHDAPVSRIVAIGLRIIKAHSPTLRVVVSYADTKQGHHGGIYQAGGWIYTGETSPGRAVLSRGRIFHHRAFTGVNYGSAPAPMPADARFVSTPAKHRYLWPFDKKMKRQIAKLAKPYPKRGEATEVD